MAVKIPTTQEQFDLAITLFQSELNQTVPEVSQAFVRVLSVILSTSHTSLYRYGVDRVIANLALTALGEDLERIGRNYGVIRKPAEAFVGLQQMTGVNGTSVPVNTVWLSDTTGLRYRTNTTEVIAGGVANVEITAFTEGSDSNMSVAETLTIDTKITGLDTTATITAVVTPGVAIEDIEVYRRRVLNEIRTVGGGSNPVDYRTWAEQTTGVARAYPYYGTPLLLVPTAKPGDRTVFVEAATDIDADGIAPQWLLDDVRENITTNPETGKSRPALGSTDATLWVESITRKLFYNQVLGLTVDPTEEVQAKLDITVATDLYYASVFPYLPGVDVATSKNDVLTRMTVSEVVQAVLNSYGATATDVNFGVAPGVFTTDLYTLAQGELAKSGGVVYA
jgi:hypothetical protein